MPSTGWAGCMHLGSWMKWVSLDHAQEHGCVHWATTFHMCHLWQHLSLGAIEIMLWLAAWYPMLHGWVCMQTHKFSNKQNSGTVSHEKYWLAKTGKQFSEGKQSGTKCKQINYCSTTICFCITNWSASWITDKGVSHWQMVNSAC